MVRSDSEQHAHEAEQWWPLAKNQTVIREMITVRVATG